jgi:hypothetical protein
MPIWIHADTSGAQIFIALSTVLVLIMGVAFSSRFGLNFAGLVVFVGFVPTMFAAVQRIVQAYTAYKSIVPNVASTYELREESTIFNLLPHFLNPQRGRIVLDGNDISRVTVRTVREEVSKLRTISVLLEKLDPRERSPGPTRRQRRRGRRGLQAPRPHRDRRPGQGLPVIREYARDRTCIVISHDMDFIAAAGWRPCRRGRHS